MKDETRDISDHLRSSLIPNIFASKYNHINSSRMFFTDGSRINGSTGFGIFNEHYTSFHKLEDPCSVYVAELAAIYHAIKTIESLPPDHYFIFSDSLSSIQAIQSLKQQTKASYFLIEIRNALNSLVDKSIRITFIWIPSHCSIPGNEKADTLAKMGSMQGTVFERQIAYREFFSISRQQSLTSWQNQWNRDELGRWLYSIIPKVSTKAWFKGLDLDRNFIRTMSRLMSNHSALNAHLFRIGLATNNLCNCGQGYHDIEHVVWSCNEFCNERIKLVADLEAQGVHSRMTVRNILATRDPNFMFPIYVFLRSANVII